MDKNQEILTDILEIEYRQQQLLEFTQSVIERAIAAGWTLTDYQRDEDETLTVGPRLHLVPPPPDTLDDLPPSSA